jgi:hypothetical protein
MKTQLPDKKHSKQLNHGAPEGWSLNRPFFSSVSTDRNDEPLIYAIISTWFDGDIIAATVKNCFINGCSKVFILDNDSPDDSVEAALSVGAEIGEIYSTTYYDDDLRIRKQNDLIKTVVEREQHRELWFLALDADEFPTGHNGETVRRTLGRLPGQIRTIGSNAIDLYPTGSERYISGEHPASCFSKGINRTAKFACEKHHWKHIALRYFEGKFDIAQSRGNHYPASAKSNMKICETSLELPIFHAPFRNEDKARERLTALCSKPDNQGYHRSAGDDVTIGNQGAIKRFNSLDAVYSQQWHKVELPHSQMYGREIVGICPYPWRVLNKNLAHLFNEKTTR